MDGTLRVGVSRNTSAAAGQTLFRNLYLLRCTISADARNSTKAVQAYFPLLARAIKALSPLSAFALDRNVRRANVKQMLTRDAPMIADLIQYGQCVTSPAMTTSRGVTAAQLVRKVFSEHVPFDHILTEGAQTFCPGVIASVIGRTMAGFLPRSMDDFEPSGPIDLLAADLVAFKFFLAYMLTLTDGSPAMTIPTLTVEEMLDNVSLLNSLDVSFGVESKSEQRMTRDMAEMSSRSLNELPHHDNRGRMPWKIMYAMLALQLKMELDQLADDRAEVQANAHVTTYGAKLFNQMASFVTVDRELLELALAVKDAGFALNPGQISSKWSAIRRGTTSHSLATARVEVRGGSWVLKDGDNVLLSVSPARLA
uniref:NS RNAb n=1 Tax=Avian orthoreovirus TaxID=38170 RepID=A0A385JBE4_9REOV|nr:NS RNAb [Avian orthoreovirus]